jgi:predicted patatin/cPLA2 family phospholipase
MSTESKKALIIQSGGFRTAFSAGVLDVFMQKN